MTTVRASKGTPLERVYSYSYIAVNPRETEKSIVINLEIHLEITRKSGNLLKSRKS